MTLDIGDALRDGVDRTVARNGLVLTAVVVGFRLANAVLQQSLSRVQFERFFDPAEFTTLFEELPVSPAEFAEAVEQSTPLAYLDSLSLSALVAGALVLAVVAEFVRIVAVRTFASAETASVPREFLSRNAGWAVLNGIVGGVVVDVLVIVGLALLVVPGVFLAVALLFVRQEIAVEDKNVPEAIAGSWRLTAGDRVGLFVLVGFLVVLGFLVPSLAGVVGGPVVGEVVSVAAGGVVLAYSVATVSRAYDRLRSEQAAGVPDAEDDAGDDDPLADIDDELLP